MSDEKSDAEIMYGSDEDNRPAPGTARIELHYLPIPHRGHAFLRLVKPDGTLRSAGTERRFSGWGRDLRDPNYRRYVAPPSLAVESAP